MNNCLILYIYSFLGILVSIRYGHIKIINLYRGFIMKKLPIIALVCALFSFMPDVSALPANQTFSIQDRINETKNTLIKKISAIFILWGDESYESQKKRLDLYRWFEERDLWIRHPKKWMKWIVTGSMPVKHPDNRVTDEEYVQYYIAYKELVKEEALTEQEEDAVRIEAMELLNAYRAAKGVKN